MTEASSQLPIPDLEPKRITVDEYHEYGPEKLELLDGYLFDIGGPSEIRRRVLALLLLNMGLLEAVTLAPERRWREAIERVYGSPSRGR